MKTNRVRATHVVAIVSAFLIGGPLASAGAAPGDLDRSFGGDGTVVRDLGPSKSCIPFPQDPEFDCRGARAVAVQPDGKPIAVGSVMHDGFSRISVARFRRSGRLDRTFSGNGRAIVDVGGKQDYGTDVAITPAGKILAAGYSGSADHYGESYGPVVVRLTRDGRLDPRFGNRKRRQGVASFGFGAQDECATIAGAFAMTLDGRRIVVAGGGCEPDELSVFRLTARGRLDTTFSGNGKHLTALGAPGRAVAIDGARRIVVGGQRKVARLLPDGSADPTFSGGQVTLDEGLYVTDLVVDPTDEILLGGSTRDAGGAPLDFFLSRLNENGAPDALFGDGGTTTTSFGSGSSQANGLALSGGGVVLAGTAGVDSRDSRFAIARYDSGGELDTEFSTDGKRTVDVPGRGTGNGLAVGPGAKLVVAGATRKMTTALVRLEG